MSTRMSFDIATIILRTVSAWALSPYLSSIELGHPVDEHGDLVAEVRPHLLEVVVGVLHGVVQQRRGDRLRADPEVGEDLRHRDRVRDVRLAALAQLPVVGALGGGVGALDEGDVGLRMMRAHGLEQAVDGTGRLGTREQARQQGAPRGDARGGRRCSRHLGSRCLRLGHAATSASILGGGHRC